MGNQWGQSVYSIIIIIAINVCENNTLEGFFPHTNRLPFFLPFWYVWGKQPIRPFTSLICRISSVYSKNFLEFSRISNKWHPQNYEANVNVILLYIFWSKILDYPKHFSKIHSLLDILKDFHGPNWQKFFQQYDANPPILLADPCWKQR